MARPRKDPKNPALKNWLVSALRRASYRWPARNQALANARVERGLYKCQMCGVEGKKEDMALDHVQPVVPLEGWDNWDGFINRLFCPSEGYQLICKSPCHDTKTMIEDEMRKSYKKEKKDKEND